MRTQHKLLLVILFNFFFLVVSVLVLYFIQNRQKSSLVESYRVQLRKNVGNIMELGGSNLRQVANDYTFWDDMVEFTRTKDPEWAKYNIATMMSNFKVNASWVFDTIKNNFYFEKDTLFRGTLDSPKLREIIDDLCVRRFIKTRILVDNKIVEIVGATIHPTDDPQRLTNPKGFFFIGKVWDKDYLEQLQSITDARISFQLYSESVAKSDENLIIFYPIKNWNNKTLGYLKIEKRLGFWREYKKTSGEIILFIIIFSGLTLVSLAYFFPYG